MASFLNPLIFWWFLILVLGLSFLPLTTKLFSSFFDRGYIFSKILGILILSYLVWLLGSLRILPFSQATIWVVFGFLALGNLILLWQSSFNRRGATSAPSNTYLILRFSPKTLALILFEEILFFLTLTFWAWVRAHEPSIRGLEKFMDFGFISSILRADFFPPRDLWLPPFSINYYYFGHLVTAVLTKLSGIDSAVTYNLMLATLFGLTFTGAFSLGMNLFNLVFRGLINKAHSLSALFCGLLAAFLVTLAGNLHTLYLFIKGIDRYWYPDATRFIPYTIHEFPSYSWVVADLHGHVLDIPFVLLTIALLISLIFNFHFSAENLLKASFSIKYQFSLFQRKLAQSKLFNFQFLLISFLLAVMYMTNAWDGIIYFILTALVLLYLHLKPITKSAKNFQLPFSIFLDRKAIASFAYFLFSIFLLGLGLFLFSLPFTLNFKPFISGIGLVRDRSPLWMLGILWGFFYFFVISFLLFLWKRKKITDSRFLITDSFILLLILLSTLLILFPEFFYIKDIYPLHYRANTMFKLGYQAFIMLSLSSAYIITRIISSPKNKFVYLFIGLFAYLFIMVAIYPYFSIRSYYNSLKNYQGLNGLVWLSQFYPDDYQAILWLRENIKGPAEGEARQGRQPLILEAAGESYTDYARVSAATGLPTVIGWPVHEWLWRGSYDEAGKRVAEVKRIYESPNLSETKNLLEKYKVEYVFVGTLERQKYPTADFTKWEKLGTPVFTSGQTALYQIP